MRAIQGNGEEPEIATDESLPAPVRTEAYTLATAGAGSGPTPPLAEGSDAATPSVSSSAGVSRGAAMATAPTGPRLSVTQGVAQDQHESSWRAIGAWQALQTRGM
jgi:hypothetical protein